MIKDVKTMLRERNPMAEIMLSDIDTNVNELFVPSQSSCDSIIQLKDLSLIHI